MLMVEPVSIAGFGLNLGPATFAVNVGNGLSITQTLSAKNATAG